MMTQSSYGTFSMFRRPNQRHVHHQGHTRTCQSDHALFCWCISLRSEHGDHSMPSRHMRCSPENLSVARIASSLQPMDYLTFCVITCQEKLLIPQVWVNGWCWRVVKQYVCLSVPVFLLAYCLIRYLHHCKCYFHDACVKCF